MTIYSCFSHYINIGIFNSYVSLPEGISKRYPIMSSSFTAHHPWGRAKHQGSAVATELLRCHGTTHQGQGQPGRGHVLRGRFRGKKGKKNGKSWKTWGVKHVKTHHFKTNTLQIYYSNQQNGELSNKEMEI